MPSLEERIKERGKAVGFDQVAVARAERYPEHEALKNWLNAGLHGTMEYMARGEAKRLDPKKVMPEAKSVITCALNYNTDYPYSTECRQEGRGWIARYAWGEDYHGVMEAMLEKFSAEISRQAPDTRCKIYVDTGPVMERVFAKHSGIGWIGKNTCLIDPKLGSWLFLGVILTDLELKPDPVIPDHCGKCAACIEACPTQAITEPYRLDARRCISYLTIEHRGEIDAELKSKMGSHLFGCDICQDVCPWNKKSPRTDRPVFQPREGFFNPDLREFKRRVEQGYPQGFKNSPLKRAKKEGLLRNLRRNFFGGSADNR
ncbi:MAG: tRNA epoxyqueuosine(34) reductase QueG [Deltaproteobacteria bacterium]|nr:tRNA epoxyqueuosine(34) reductase QueG [Deltaproteobacteria bacterium]